MEYDICKTIYRTLCTGVQGRYKYSVMIDKLLQNQGHKLLPLLCVCNCKHTGEGGYSHQN